MKAGAADLLERAADDEATLHLLEVREIPFGQHAQATIEKLLKAPINELGHKYPRKHDLEKLAGELTALSEALPSITVNLEDLTDYALAFRYDGTPNLPPPLDRASCLNAVEVIRNFVLGRIQALHSSQPFSVEQQP